MKKLFVLSTLLISLLFPSLVSHMVLADSAVNFAPQSTKVNDVGGCDGEAKNSAVCTDIQSDKNPVFGPDGILTRVAQIFALLTGIISTFVVILSGSRYVLSAGDPQKTATARKGIMYAAIGVAVSMSAGAIAQFILSKV